MTNFILLHGFGRTGDDFWFPWLAAELEQQGHSVWRPDLPNPEAPDLAVWTLHIVAQGKFNTGTVIVGHSAGAALVLSVLAALKQPVKRAILVAGFVSDLPLVPPENPVYLHDPDWERIKGNAAAFYFINSDNDPWGCDHKQGERLRDKLGGTLIIPSSEGHFGSAVFEQPYDTFPLLKALCLLP